MSSVTGAEDKDFGNDSVVSVVDTDRSGVINKVRGSFFKKYEPRIVETRGWKVLAEIPGTVEKDRCGDVFEDFIGREGDSVWATRRGGSKDDGTVDELEVRLSKERGVNVLVVVGQVILTKIFVCVANAPEGAVMV